MAPTAHEMVGPQCLGVTGSLSLQCIRQVALPWYRQLSFGMFCYLYVSIIIIINKFSYSCTLSIAHRTTPILAPEGAVWSSHTKDQTTKDVSRVNRL